MDLLGFGRSDKPLLAYSIELWKQLVLDFLHEVVKTPAVLVANSLGSLISLVVRLACSFIFLCCMECGLTRAVSLLRDCLGCHTGQNVNLPCLCWHSSTTQSLKFMFGNTQSMPI